jgi:hypothetical protein
MDQEEMKKRTKEFAKQVINQCRQLPETREGRLIGGQLFRSGHIGRRKLPRRLPGAFKGGFHFKDRHRSGRGG